MKSFLKAIAKIATIVALLALLVVLANFLISDSTNFWANTNWFGLAGPEWLTTGFVIALAVGTLLIAALISPKGFNAGIQTVGKAVRNVVKGVTDIATEGFKGLWDGVSPLLLAVGAGLLLLLGLRSRNDSSTLVKGDVKPKQVAQSSNKNTKDEEQSTHPAPL